MVSQAIRINGLGILTTDSLVVPLSYLAYYCALLFPAQTQHTAAGPSVNVLQVLAVLTFSAAIRHLAQGALVPESGKGAVTC